MSTEDSDQRNSLLSSTLTYSVQITPFFYCTTNSKEDIFGSFYIMEPPAPVIHSPSELVVVTHVEKHAWEGGWAGLQSRQPPKGGTMRCAGSEAIWRFGIAPRNLLATPWTRFDSEVLDKHLNIRVANVSEAGRGKMQGGWPNASKSHTISCLATSLANLCCLSISR